MNDQRSTWEQLLDLYVLANEKGLRLAAETILKDGIQKFQITNCPHPYIWPNGDCISCQRLATTLPGKVEDYHKMLARLPKVPEGGNVRQELYSLYLLANKNGFYDAADFVMSKVQST